jgi:phage-related protein
MGAYKYLFYTEGNRCYAGDFIRERSEKERGKIKYYLDLLETRDPMLRAPYAEKVSPGICELKPAFGNTEIRLLYFWDGNTAWFVHGIVKKTRKTPQAAINLAEERMQRYFRAKTEGKR